MQAETRSSSQGQRIGSPAEDGGGSFGDFIGGDLPQKLALLVVRTPCRRPCAAGIHSLCSAACEALHV